MTLQQLQIVFCGVEAVVILFGFYGLYEWGLHLLNRVKAGTLAPGRAQTLFGIAAAVLSLLPFVLIVIAMRLQPFGELELFNMSDANTIFALFGSLLLGFVLQGLAGVLFWYVTRRRK